MSNSIDITPSPRILRMLGQIDFSAIQCLCELIDNSIDAFADSSQPSSSSPETIVRVPNIKRLTETSEILISDNGAGMDIDQLNRSLKAGFSSNNPVDKMGLFGMGFNIATARLGQKTEIKTSKINLCNISEYLDPSSIVCLMYLIWPDLVCFSFLKAASVEELSKFCELDNDSAFLSLDA